MDYRTFRKSSEWVYRLCFPKGDSDSSRGLIPLRQTCIGAQSLPSVALSSGAVKAFLLYHKLYFFERIVYLNLRLGDDLIIPG